MEDIAPALLEAIRSSFKTLLGDAAVTKKTYTGAAEYAERVGAALSGAFGSNLSSEVLPDERMYWNIADRTVRPMLEQGHNLVADATAQVQQTMNEAAGIGLKAQAAPVNTERVDSILNKLSSAEQYDDAVWILDEPVKTFIRCAVDDTLRKNVDFQGKAGLSPRIIRTAESHCCKWCSKLEGTYRYPDVPDDIYRRHNRCRCAVEYDPGGGMRQNVHTKKWTTQEERDKIEQRKRFSENESVQRQTREKEPTAWDSMCGSQAWTKTKQKAMYHAEYGTTRSPVEISRLYTGDGAILFKKAGDSDSVSFVANEIKQMHGGVLTHNHPNDGCFSTNDINMLRYGKLKEIRAVTSQGVYRMQAPASWSRKISNLEKVRQEYDNIDATVSKSFFDRARMGEISYREADRLGQHAVIQEFSRRYKIPFAFDSWDEIRKVMK